MGQGGLEAYKAMNALCIRFDRSVGQHTSGTEDPEFGVGAGDIGAAVSAGLPVEFVVEKRAGAAARQRRPGTVARETHISAFERRGARRDTGGATRHVE